MPSVAQRVRLKKVRGEYALRRLSPLFIYLTSCPCEGVPSLHVPLLPLPARMRWTHGIFTHLHSRIQHNARRAANQRSTYHTNRPACRRLHAHCHSPRGGFKYRRVCALSAFIPSFIPAAPGSVLSLSQLLISLTNLTFILLLPSLRIPSSLHDVDVPRT